MNLVLLLSLLGLFGSPVVQADVRQPSARESTDRSRTQEGVPQAAGQTPAPVSASARVVAPTTPTVTPKPVASSPAAPAPATAAPAPVSTFAQDVEQEIFKLVNAERVKDGLVALAADTKLDKIARAHSEDMLSKGYFSHTNTSGCSSSCRATLAGYAWRAVGENIYTMTGYDMGAKETAHHMVDGWMNSPGHRANILNASFTHHGIGLAVSGKTLYATSVFALPL